MSDPIVVLMLIAVLTVWAGEGLGWILPIGFLRKDDDVSRNQRFWGRMIFSLIGIALAAYVILSPDYGIAEKTAAWGAVTAKVFGSARNRNSAHSASTKAPGLKP